MLRLWPTVAWVALFAISCTAKKEEAKYSQPILTRQEAIARAGAVSNVTYEQEFWLSGINSLFPASWMSVLIGTIPKSR